jgi:enediyne biosynthesis protein E4
MGTSNATRRLPVVLALLLLVGAAGWFVYQYWFKNNHQLPGQGDTQEATLTAKDPLLVLLEPGQSGVDFENHIIETPQNNVTNNINMYNGGGVAVADFNNDGLPDIYFVCSNGKNKLYLNQGNLQFKDITDSAGVGSENGFETAVTAADVNADGFLDLYICRGGPQPNDDRRNQLFINNGNLTFTEKAREFGIDDISASSGANFFDYDNDGDLDLYLLNYPTDLSWASRVDARKDENGNLTPNTEPKNAYDSDRFYRNEGGKFTDVSKEAGIWNFAYGLSVSVSDFNNDGYTDVYVGNDFIHADFLYINNKKGGFTNEIRKYLRHSSLSTMGTELSDFDNDGRIDIFAVDMLPDKNYRQKTVQSTMPLSRYISLKQAGYFEPVVRNVMQRNNGNGTFSDVACLAGPYKTDWSWSGLFADFDNDGRKDLHITNGYRREITNLDYMEFFLGEMDKMTKEELDKKYRGALGILEAIPTFKARDYIFRNEGPLQFTNKSGDWATMKPSWSCGGAWCDLDADGDLDLVVNNLEEPAFIFKNTSRERQQGHYLQARLSGTPLNPFAIGASVRIRIGADIQYQELFPTRGIFSSVEPLIHFGVGQATQVDELTVRWPDGKTQTLQNIPADQRLQLKYADAAGYVASLCPPAPGKTLFSDISSGLNFIHKENTYNDFENFPMNIWKETDLGPLVAKGDVNGDGLDDVFIGNAFQSPAGLYQQLPDGAFKLLVPQGWEYDKVYEDHGAAFFDMEGDGDLDLYVVSGGAEAVPQSRNLAWQGRIYINTDGKGTLVKAAQNALPNIQEVGLRVIPFDYDNDGYKDLIIGGRVTADKWPLTPRSLVLHNERNRLVDVTAQVAGDFERCGMVTDLAMVNVDADPQPELVAVGEWMPVSVFKLKGGRFVNITEQVGLSKSHGIWFRLAAADLDGDGDQDLISGNLGLNTRFSAGQETPLCCFAKDFDNNGALDPVVSMYEGNQNYPLLQKAILTKQMPGLKKKFLYASAYGKATVQDVLTEKAISEAMRLEAFTLETCWWENQGGKFVRHSLPAQAQVSPIQGILTDDFNGDGLIDLLVAGNKYGFEVESGPCDSGNGVLLAGDGKGGFRWVDNLESGFWATREVRDMTQLRAAGGKKIIVVANNNSAAQVFRN